MNGYETIKETAERWNLTVRRVQKLCSEGRIPGVIRFGKVWAIPRNVNKPDDARIKTGLYRNWRKNKEDL